MESQCLMRQRDTMSAENTSRVEQKAKINMFSDYSLENTTKNSKYPTIDLVNLQKYLRYVGKNSLLGVCSPCVRA